MKTINRFTILFIFFSVPVFAQWIPIEGAKSNNALHIRYIKHNSDYLIASTPCGIFTKALTTNQWVRLNYPSTNLIYLFGDSLFTTYYKSLSIVDLNQSPFIENIQAFPFYNGGAMALKDSLLYISSSEGVHVSIDWGVSTYQYISGMDVDTTGPVSSPQYHVYIADLISTDQHIFSSTDKGVYRSDHSLNGWTLKNSGLSSPIIRKLYHFNNKLFALSFDTLFISNDQGDNWSYFAGGNYTIKDMTMINNEIYISTDSLGIFKTPDNGLTWQGFNNGLNGLPVSQLNYAANNFYCVAGYNQIYKWNGSQWNKEDNSGMYCSLLMDMESTDSNLFISDNGKVFKLKKGDAWEDVSPTDSAGVICGELERAGNSLITMGLVPGSGNRLYYSYDNGQNWQYALIPPAYLTNYNYSLKYINNKVFIYDESGDIFYTPDLGQSWFDISIIFSSCGDNLNDLMYFNGKLMASNCRKSVLLEFDDTDSSWNLKAGLFPQGTSLQTFAKNDTTVYIGSSSGSIFSRGLTGSTWQAINSFPGSSFIFGSERADSKFFIVGDSEVHYLNDNDTTWHDLNDNLSNSIFTMEVEHFNDSLYLSTRLHGVFKRAMPGNVASQEFINIHSSGFKLYPNPAIDKIIIDTDNAGTGTFQIVDAAGKILYEGKYTDGEALNLPSIKTGVYIITVQSGKINYHQRLLISN